MILLFLSTMKLNDFESLKTSMRLQSLLCATILSTTLLSACTSYEPVSISRNDFYNSEARNTAGQNLVDCLNDYISKTPDATTDAANIALQANKVCEQQRETAFYAILQTQLAPDGQPIHSQQAQQLLDMKNRFNAFTLQMIQNNIEKKRTIKL